MIGSVSSEFHALGLHYVLSLSGPRFPVRSEGSAFTITGPSLAILEAIVRETREETNLEAESVEELHVRAFKGQKASRDFYRVMFTYLVRPRNGGFSAKPPANVMAARQVAIPTDLLW